MNNKKMLNGRLDDFTRNRRNTNESEIVFMY